MLPRDRRELRKAARSFWVGRWNLHPPKFSNHFLRAFDGARELVIGPNCISVVAALRREIREREFYRLFWVELLAPSYKEFVERELEICPCALPVGAMGFLWIQLVGLRAIAVDMTERNEAEHKLARRADELERANRELARLHIAKDDFMAAVSHQLRTPLVTGMGYVDLLLEGSLGEVSQEVRAAMEIAVRNLRRLSTLVDDILNQPNGSGAKGYDTFAMRFSDGNA